MKKSLVLIIALFSLMSVSKASHIVGGDVIVKWIGPTKNDFQVQVRVYRSCQPGAAGMPGSVSVNMYDLVTYAPQGSSINIVNPTITRLAFGDDCFTPTGLCVDEGVFIQNVTIPDNPSGNGYFFAYQIAARNAGITNIANSSSTAMTFYCEIPNPGNPATLNNSSPDIGIYPLDAYLCVNNSKQFQFNVSDADGDSLVYSLTQPLDQTAINPAPAFPYGTCAWAPGYSLANIVGGLTPMSINQSTGVITAEPNLLGTFVFAVRVEEFRNGVKIGETRRDVQYEALNCTTDSPPFEISGLADSTIVIPFAEEFCLDIIFQDSDIGDTVFLEISSPIFQLGAYGATLTPYQTNPNLYLYTYNHNNDSVLIPQNTYIDSLKSFMNIGTIAYRFCWTPGCEHLSDIPYDFNVKAFSLGCSGRIEDTLDFKIEVARPVGILTLIPNVFTPNGDGMNDTYKIDGYSNPCTDKLIVEIYNRWGLKVYQSEDYDFEWDGKNKSGHDVPPGTYFVVVKGIYGEIEIEEEKHTVSLMR